MKKSNNRRRSPRKNQPKQYPRLYSCTQQNAVSVSKLAWGYCLALITRFFGFSPRYTAELVADMVKQANDANALPNQEQRTNARKTAHVELTLANDAVCLQWQSLKRYIEIAYSKALVKIKLDAAGYMHYRKAAGGRWENTLGLIKDAKEFMAQFAEELEANNNMPKEFPTSFDNIADAFVTERNRYVGSTQSAKEGTNTKDKAIYDVEVELSKLLAAGKVIFEKEPVNLKKFTFDELINEVRGNEPAGLKGYLNNATDGQPLAGVVVSSADYSTMTDEDGRYELRMASGSYDIKFEKPGFETLVLEGRVVRVGVMGRFNAEMQEAQPGEALDSGMTSNTEDAASNEESAGVQPSAGG